MLGMRPVNDMNLDGQLIEFDEFPDLSTTGRSLTESPYMRVKTSAVAEKNVNIYGSSTTLTFSAKKQYGAGVFIRGPGHDVDLLEYYDMQFHLCTFDQRLQPIPVIGIGPATISTSDAGNRLSIFQCFEGEVHSDETGNVFQGREFLHVKPFTGSYADRPLFFGMVIYNDHTRSINAPYHYNIAIFRNHGHIPQWTFTQPNRAMEVDLCSQACLRA